ncbi:hypothetical protein AgCh_010218 [Apium graveolens]
MDQVLVRFKEVKLTGHEDRIRKLVNEKMDEIIPSQVKITSKFQHIADQMKRLDLTTMENEVKTVEATFGSSTSTSSTSTNIQIQYIQQQVSDLQTSNVSLNAQVQALTSLVKSQQSNIQILMDSHKHLQMQNYVALGAIMGKLNIPLPSLPEQTRPEIPTPLLMLVTKTKGEIEARIQQSRDGKAKYKELIQVGQSSSQVDVGKERFLKAAEGPNQDQEFNDLLAALRLSLQNNYVTCKKALAKNINFIRAVVVTLTNLQTLRASELDVMIDRVNPVIPEDTQLLQELKKAQITAFPEAYLYPNQGVVYVCPTTKQARHLLVPKHCVRSNMRLIMTLQSDIKYKRNKKDGDVEMIKILDRYLINPNTMLPNTQYNLRKDKDDDEQKDDRQKPSGSNPSQVSKATDSKDKSQGENKEDEKKDGENEDYFQQLAEEIVRVWVVSLREVRIYYEDGSFTFLGCTLMDSLSPTEIKRVISLLKDKDTATRAWRSVSAEWLIVRKKRRKRNVVEYEERKIKYDEEIEKFIKISEELKAKGMSRISKDGKFLNIKAR